MVHRSLMRYVQNIYQAQLHSYKLSWGEKERSSPPKKQKENCTEKKRKERWGKISSVQKLVSAVLLVVTKYHRPIVQQIHFEASDAGSPQVCRNEQVIACNVSEGSKEPSVIIGFGVHYLVSKSDTGPKKLRRRRRSRSYFRGQFSQSHEWPEGSAAAWWSNR